ncbi:hypothetical protein [Kitasatospora sp. NPDC015120]|uniref:hypothetical protein n=1 Tax=Kitasatospora sp. NPDC015120 TaxID=3364023 RepID=UPI0036F49939
MSEPEILQDLSTGQQLQPDNPSELLDVFSAGDHVTTGPDTNREQLSQQNGD